ncbi:hypothetical protein BDQ17DRAFT_1413638 [Cyathus striatus]|nr:hypothetical protein BDQ17DRAFT_1413638 [Cyathus striatus]
MRRTVVIEDIYEIAGGKTVIIYRAAYVEKLIHYYEVSLGTYTCADARRKGVCLQLAMHRGDYKELEALVHDMLNTTAEDSVGPPSYTTVLHTYVHSAVDHELYPKNNHPSPLHPS